MKDIMEKITGGERDLVKLILSGEELLREHIW